MAEISYPFAEDNATGGTKTVSQVEWQNMAHLWGSDRIDFRMTAASYSLTQLPLYAAISGTDLVIQSGAAWVGGFYYKNTGPLTKPAPTNSGSLPRTDLVVIQADMAKGSVNLVIKQGTPAANPIEPLPQMALGGLWEMALWAIKLGANNGARTLEDRRRFDGPGYSYAPWNVDLVSAGMPINNFVLDVDANSNDSQREIFTGRDGYVVTRHLGKTREYVPSLVNTASTPGVAKRLGRWRWISPNVYHFSVNINNDNVRNSTGSPIGIVLPHSAAKMNHQIISGIINNPKESGGAPNIMAVTGRVAPGATTLHLYVPNWTNLAQGLDGLMSIPANASLEVSGVIEANQFNE